MPQSLTMEQMRKIVRDNLPSVITKVNEALHGRRIRKLEPVLNRLGRGGVLPHWYEGLRDAQTLPNLDGKTVGSVVEMVLVAVLETYTFAGLQIPKLKINPAKGVDLPDLGLGVKSPSENFCTSEPFFSAYERLLGSDHDVLVLLTDYQTAKKKSPFRLQIINYNYLTKTQVADKNLCRLARKHRKRFVDADEARAKRFFRFLAYVNQADWRAKRLLSMLDQVDDESAMRAIALESKTEFAKINASRIKKDRLPLPDDDLRAITNVLKLNVLSIGLIDAIDNWVMDMCKESARAPNEDEWGRLKSGPLDGKIGMSLALQWRYNFGPLFGAGALDDESDCNP